MVTVQIGHVWVSYGLDQPGLALLWSGLVRSGMVMVWISYVWNVMVWISYVWNVTVWISYVWGGCHLD